MTSRSVAGDSFLTDVPARLDRMPWSRFHWLVVAALGITWILDGLEVTLVGALSPAIASPQGLGLNAAQIGLAGSAYIAGAVLGAVVFGRLTDHFGRKRLFLVTVAVYLLATIATGFSWDFYSFLFFRFVTGMGIGGEYGAVNSAIQELIPARRRGQVDLAINGSFWVGAAIGSLGSVVVLDPNIIDQEWGWRIAFFTGGILAVIIVYIRRWLPESPRWLMTHGRQEEAERIVTAIEAQVFAEKGAAPADEAPPKLRLTLRKATPWTEVIGVLLRRYPKRTALGITLMATQAFCYNAIFFSYALVLTRFYDVPAQQVGWFMLPFALGNFLGPLLLGGLFDTLGRKTMIAGTYGLAGVLLCVTGWMFEQEMLSAVTQTVAWTVIFFFASAGASAAYLTVGESFPLEVRAVCISLFYAFGTAIGGVAGPAVFGAMIESGARLEIFWGYLLGGGMMLLAAVVEAAIGVKAERLPLEQVAEPLSLARD